MNWALLLYGSALNLVPGTLTPLDQIPGSVASQWTPQNVEAQINPAAISAALSPQSWATPQAIIPDVYRGLAVAAVTAVLL